MTGAVAELPRDVQLPYVPFETNADNLIKSFQPVVLPEKQWVGVADLGIIRTLTDGLGIQLPADAVGRAQTELLRAVYAIYGNQLAIIDAADLHRGIERLIARIFANEPMTLVATMDSMLAPNIPAFHITRFVDRVGNSLGKGPRPGYPDLNEQIEQIVASHPQQKQAVLVDDVLFTAGSAIKIAEKFNHYGVQVTTLIVGVATQEGIDILKQRGISVLPLVIAPDPIDVVDMRDFIGGAPLGGRVIGSDDGTGLQPLRDINGIGFRLPYTAPKGNPEEWAHIPPAEVIDFSAQAWEASDQVYEAIEQHLGREVTVFDLTRSTLPIGFPQPPPQRMRENSLEIKYPFRRVLSHNFKRLTNRPLT